MEDFFISYAQADRRWAEWIAWQLEDAGFTTILQAWDFKAGTNWVLNMKKATQQSKRTIAILSEDYLKSPNAQAEWAAAFSADPSGSDGKVIPIRVKPVELSGLDKCIVFVDFVDKDRNEAMDLLLGRLKEVRSKPSVQPIFPGSEIPTRHIPAFSAPVFPGFDREPYVVSHRDSSVTDVHFQVPTALNGELPSKLNIDLTIQTAPARLLITFDQEAFGIDYASGPSGASVTEIKSDCQFAVTLSAADTYRLAFDVRAKKIENVNGYLHILLAVDNGAEVKAEKHWVNITPRPIWLPTWLRRLAPSIVVPIIVLGVLLKYDWMPKPINNWVAMWSENLLIFCGAAPRDCGAAPRDCGAVQRDPRDSSDLVVQDNFTDTSLDSKNWSSGAKWSLVNVRAPSGDHDALLIAGNDIGFLRTPSRFYSYYNADLVFEVPIMDPIRQKSVDWVIRLQHRWWGGDSYYRFTLTFPTSITERATLSASLFINGAEVKSLGSRQLTLFPFVRKGSSIKIITMLREFDFTGAVIYDDKCHPPCDEYNEGTPHSYEFQDSGRALPWGLIGFVGPSDKGPVEIQYLTLKPVPR